MDIRHKDLEAFLAVARAGSFRQAATDRGVTPSALSQSLRALEERMQVRLLNRTTRSVALTEAGDLLQARLTPAFADIEAAVDEVLSLGGRPAGRVRINAPAPPIEHILMPVVPGFLATYPEISLEIIEDAGYVDIVRDGYDAGIRFGLEMAQDMIAVPLADEVEYAVVASPGYLEVRGVPEHPDDLLAHDCIRHRFPGGSIFTWRFARDGVDVALTPNGRLTVNHAHYARAAAEAGSGLARLALPYVEPQLTDGRLIRVLQDWSPTIGKWHLYYPSRRQAPPAFKAFLSYIRSAQPR
ncbi:MULTISPECIES: LysR family transcriptional regulator [Thalassobaculum]|uniref:DNA-binding transcriptional regulator, LysR family n=1 Tax=Thalassobaculum litoreum DSM 18839 TaxID=1123362 RepID=A0A8G2EZC2_9PROT|nr:MULTISPECIES: LysR family transcriptional regulator [Thalassobaculum]SDG17245.1 DNA-binding transcriptional regulator, LysR family [Thalassobaculum litoreum DSM 18839]